MRVARRFVPPTVVLLLLSAVLYPLETAKKLSQVSGSLGHKKINNSPLELLKNTPVKHLYRGFSMQVLKLAPYSFLHYTMYEMAKRTLNT